MTSPIERAPSDGYRTAFFGSGVELGSDRIAISVTIDYTIVTNLNSINATKGKLLT